MLRQQRRLVFRKYKDTVEVGDAVNELYFVAYVEHVQVQGAFSKLITNDETIQPLAIGRLFGLL